MNSMKSRGDNEPSEESFHSSWQDNICVMKLHDGKKQHFINNEFLKLQPEEQDERDSKEAGKHNLSKMKANRGGDVHGKFGVMCPVKTPEKIDVVIYPVPGVGPQVEQHNC